MFSGPPVKQHQDHQPQQSKGDVAVNSPGQRGVGAEPLILGEHTQHDPCPRQQIDYSSQPGISPDMITAAPHVVEQHIKNRHGDGGDPLSNSQRRRVVLQPGGTQSHRPGHKMEGVPRPQYHRHDAEQTELLLSPAPGDHFHAQGNHRHQIDHVKGGLHNSLHGNSSFYQSARRATA